MDFCFGRRLKDIGFWIFGWFSLRLYWLVFAFVRRDELSPSCLGYVQAQYLRRNFNYPVGVQM